MGYNDAYCRQQNPIDPKVYNQTDRHEVYDNGPVYYDNYQQNRDFHNQFGQQHYLPNSAYQVYQQDPHQYVQQYRYTNPHQQAQYTHNRQQQQQQDILREKSKHPHQSKSPRNKPTNVSPGRGLKMYGGKHVSEKAHFKSEFVKNINKVNLSPNQQYSQRNYPQKVIQPVYDRNAKKDASPRKIELYQVDSDEEEKKCHTMRSHHQIPSNKTQESTMNNFAGKFPQ